MYAAPSPVSFAPAAIADTALRRAADCSIDFILLGLVAAHLDGAQHWSAWNQSAIVPASVRDVRFAIERPCRKYTHPTHGFDRHDPTRTVDVSDISCLGGWSAGNVVMSSAAAVNWTWALFGTTDVIPNAALMVPNASDVYGLATFGFSGQYANGTRGIAYGHLGDTYGFTSIVSYFPYKGLALAVGTNAEAREQTAPREVLCLAYNRVLDEIGGRAQKPRVCRYVARSYYESGCECSA